LGKIRPTSSSLLDLFSHESDGGEQFHHDLDDNFSYCRRRWEFGVDIETVEEVFDGLEEIYEGIVACTDVLDCLIW
jgi:hypothetical protein